MLPRGMISERPWARFQIRIYNAEGLPTMDSGLMAKVAMVTDRTVFIDPYVRVTFAGQQVRRSTCRSADGPAGPLYHLCSPRGHLKETFVIVPKDLRMLKDISGLYPLISLFVIWHLRFYVIWSWNTSWAWIFGISWNPRGRRQLSLPAALRFGMKRSPSSSSFHLWLSGSEFKSWMMQKWETSSWPHTSWTCSRFLTLPGMVQCTVHIYLVKS